MNKNMNDKPRTWEEFCKRGFTGDEAYINIGGVAKSQCLKGEHRDSLEVGYVCNIKEAKEFLALMQLRQLRKAWVGDWEPDWNDSSTKYTICVYYGDVVVWNTRTICYPLSFPTEEMAIEFFDCFKDLLEQAKMLL